MPPAGSPARGAGLERRVKRLEVLRRRERFVDRPGNGILHAVGALQVVDQALPELALLVPQQLASGRLIDRREVRREVAQTLAGQDVVDADQRAEIALRRGAQEGRQPDQRPRPCIASSEVVEAGPVVGRRMALIVEGEVDDHLAFIPPRRQRLVGQLPHVGEDNLESAARAAPGRLVVKNDLVAVLDAERIEQDLANQAAR